MKVLLISLALLWRLGLTAQCTFEYYKSYPNCDEDYLDVFDLKDEKEIVALGVSQPRAQFDTSGCNHGFLFRKFDYCGNVVKEKIYSHFGSLSYFWSVPFAGIDHNNTYNRDGYNIVHRDKNSYFMGIATDSISQNYYNVFLVLDKEGEILFQKSYSAQMIDAPVQHLVLFNDGRILAISHDESTNNYRLNWLDSNGDIRKQGKVDITNDINLLYPKETSDGQLCFTGIKMNLLENNSVFVFKIDTIGKLLWTYEDHKSVGYARDLFVKDSNLIVCASINDSISNKRSLVLLELSNDGHEISKKIISTDKYYIGDYYSISLIKAGNGHYYVATDMTPYNQSQYSVSIISLDNDFNLDWFKYFYKKDNLNFGHKITECSDGGLAIIGEEKHKRPNEYGTVIIKTTTDAPVSTKSIYSDDPFSIYPNPVNDYLYYSNEKNDSDTYLIYSIDGQLIERGIANQGKVSVSNLISGVYYIKLLDRNNIIRVNKFVKL